MDNMDNKLEAENEHAREEEGKTKENKKEKK